MADIKIMNFGKHLVVIGLLLQILFFGIFILTASIFHYRITRSPTPASIHHSWKPHVYTLYIASTLILIRSVFRVIEFSGGNDGILLRREAFLYGFDALLMIGVMVVFNFLHPGQVLAGRAPGNAIRLGDRSGSEDDVKFEIRPGNANPAGWL
jgi:hypothetical protein